MYTILNKIPFLRFFIPFVVGILLTFQFNHESLFLNFTIVSYVLLVILYFLLLKKQSGIKKNLFGITVHFFFFSIGLFCTYINQQHHSPFHFSKQLANEPNYFLGTINNIPEEKEKSTKVFVSLINQKVDGNWQNCKGELLMYLEKSTTKKIKYGNLLVFTGKPELVEEPKNPFEFNYKKYLALKNIQYRLFCKETSYFVSSESYNNNSLFDLAQQLKIKTYDKLQNAGLHNNELAIASALLLGYDDGISGNLMNAYSSTGTLHVLSVSGLHIGLLFLLLNAILFFPDTKKFRVIKSCIILFVLWFYAMLTGLSPSVVRATTMFSFILIGNLLNRKGQVYNTVIASAFVILLFNPLLLFDVGFQLSYLAVLGIIFFYPYIYNWFFVRNKWVNMIWKLSAVSISAQIATIPISFYYFHQFPTLFILSNLLIIPLSNIAMGGALLIALFSFWPDASRFFAMITGKIIEFMNEITFGLDTLSFLNFSEVSINNVSMILLCLVIVSLSFAFINKSIKLFYTSGFLILLLISLSIYEDILSKQNNQITVYNANKETCIDIYEGNNCIEMVNKKDTDTENTFYTSTNRIKRRVKKTKTLPLKKGVFQLNFNAVNYLVCNGDTLNKYDSTLFSNKVVLLVNNPYLKNSDLSTAKLVVADASNNYKTLRYLTQHTDEEKLWITKSKGAYINSK